MLLQLYAKYSAVGGKVVEGAVKICKAHVDGGAEQHAAGGRGVKKVVVILLQPLVCDVVKATSSTWAMSATTIR